MVEFRNTQFKSWVQRYNLKNKNILEVGSNKGENLEILKKICNKTYGLEHNPESIKFSKRKKLKVYQGYLDKKLKLPSIK